MESELDRAFNVSGKRSVRKAWQLAAVAAGDSQTQEPARGWADAGLWGDAQKNDPKGASPTPDNQGGVAIISAASAAAFPGRGQLFGASACT